jgi:hypothetical protein
MSRYIDADKLKYSLELSVKSWGRDCNSRAPVIKTTYQDVLNRLEAMPAADVVEVRHGERVVKKLNNPFYESKKSPHCSECNYMCFIRYDYCPNCGAKMDGERSENGK